MIKNKCVFCSLIEQRDKELCSKLENTILYEDDLVLIKPALGMSISNYLIVFSKKHINGFAEFDLNKLNKLEKLLEKICNEYKKILGIYPLIFEHGSLKAGRHPLSITHAHLHIVPIELSNISLNNLFNSLKLEQKPNINFLKDLEHKDYWLYRSKIKKYYMSHSVNDAPRSCFIKIVAKEAGYDVSYEWRDTNNNRKSDIIETIDTFKKINLK